MLETGKDEAFSFPERTLLHLGKGAQAVGQEAGEEEEVNRRKKKAVTAYASATDRTMIHHSGSEALLTLFTVLLLLLGMAEYYLLTLVDSLVLEYPLVAKAAAGLLRMGNVLRLGFLLVYVGLCTLVVRTSAKSSATSRSHEWTTKLLTSLAVAVVAYCLVTIRSYPMSTVYWLYPASLVGSLLVLPVLVVQLCSSIRQTAEQSERRRIDTEQSVVIKTKNGYINVVNPYRGSLVIGSSGSGKSASIGNAFLHQFVQKGFCGVSLRLQVSDASQRFEHCFASLW